MEILKKQIDVSPLPTILEQHASPADYPITTVEKLTTIKSVANTLGLPIWKLSRAASQGLFPTYRLLNSRRLVKLSEIVAAIEASRQGGAE